MLKRPPLIRLVDDDPVVLESLRFMLEMAGLEVVCYPSAAAFLESDAREREGCLLLDVRMPEMSGLELQRRLKNVGNDLPVVFLSAHGDIKMAVQAVHDGAVDFLVKPPEAEELVRVLQRASALHTTRRALQRDLDRLNKIWMTLTEAEKRTAELIGKGLPNRHIAEVLALSEDTVRSRRASIFAKLDVQNAVEISDFLREIERLREQKTW